MKGLYITLKCFGLPNKTIQCEISALETDKKVAKNEVYYFCFV